MKYLIQYPDKTLLNVALVGGKAKNLYTLTSMKLNVPKWCVIPTSFFDNNQNAEYVDLLNEISAVFDQKNSAKKYAVRSSASDEDNENHSFAGIYKSVLNVSFQELETAIKEVRASLNSEAVKTYRKANQLNNKSDIAVIVQELIESDVSGIGFSKNPLKHNLKESIITATYGLGEGLVSGELEADTFFVENEKITQTVATKTEKYIVNAHGFGIEKVAVSNEVQNIASLSKSQILQIDNILQSLEKHYGHPQDVEFSIKDEVVYLLQTRPITKYPKGEYILWDNSNIVESYPGITTPLTFSFINRVYEQVYIYFVAFMGVPETEIRKHKTVFANTLGLIRGRVYYNLLSWYKMLAMAPGYSLNAGFMETMMGVKERFELDEKYQMSKNRARWRIFLMVIRIIRIHIGLQRERKRFVKHINLTLEKYQSLQLEELSAEEIIRQYKLFEKSLILEWKAPLINDFFSMIWFGLLKKKCEQYFPNHPNLHNDLLCGSQDIISVQPVHRSLAIVDLIKKDSNILVFFKSHTVSEIWNALQKGEFPEIKVKIDEYISDFGNRCIGELKLESISYEQEPTRFVALIQAYVKENVSLFREKGKNIDTEVREKAESLVKNQFKGSFFKKLFFNYILKKARDLVSNRENLRYERTRVFGMVRKFIVAIGHKFEELEVIEQKRDVFYLKLEEIEHFDSKTLRQEFKSLVKTRKIEFDEYKNQVPPEDRFYTYGHHFTDDFIYSKEKVEHFEGDILGVGCCPGIVEGIVTIVDDPNDINSLNGTILVAVSTDPGWVKLFPSCAAIIVERGSLLSHSAIVSREMGIPCIVGATGILKVLKSGDRITMDGSSGKIKKLEDEKT
jgi:phosphohistidine swiveling domain-containing protein